MILVLSGTKEGTEIISLLAGKGYKICAVTATSYGTKLASDLSGVNVVETGLSKEDFKVLCHEQGIFVVIDATHPFPSSISNTAREYSELHQVPYIRFLREEVELPENPLINIVYSWEEAAYKAASFGDTIFLTTGSNNLENFLSYKPVKGKRVVVRVLPDYKIIEKVQSLGLTPKDIVAMQGPFSREMNRLQFKMYNASVIVTKDSGKAGGTDTKISAAVCLGLPVVLIKRRRQENKYEVTDYSKLLELLTKIVV